MTVPKNENSTGDSFRDELEWSAFRYAADEMTPDESTAFEQRLAEDQQAREALARTVQLTHAVMSLPVVTVDSRTDADRKRVDSRWASMAAIFVVTALAATFAIGLRFSNITPQSYETGGSITKVESSYSGRDLVLAAWLDFKADEELPEKSFIREEDPSEVVPATISPELLAPEDDGKFDWVVAAADPESMENGNIED